MNYINSAFVPQITSMTVNSDHRNFISSLVNPVAYSLNNQFVDKATQTVRYHCQKCGSRFRSKFYLNHHETVHNINLICPFCPSLFSNKGDFRKHVNAHNEMKFLPCSYCNKIFHKIKNYEEHIKNHAEKAVTSCNICPAKFQQVSALRKHMLTHLQKKYIHLIAENSSVSQCEKENNIAQHNNTYKKTNQKSENIIRNKTLRKCKNNLESGASGSNMDVTELSTPSCSNKECNPVQNSLISTNSEYNSQNQSNRDDICAADFQQKYIRNKKKSNRNVRSTSDMKTRSKVIKLMEVENVSASVTNSSNVNATEISTNLNMNKRICKGRIKKKTTAVPIQNVASVMAISSRTCTVKALKRGSISECKLRSGKVVKKNQQIRVKMNEIRKFYICTVCNISSNRLSYVRKHMLIHKRNRGSHICSQCQARFKLSHFCRTHEIRCKVRNSE